MERVLAQRGLNWSQPQHARSRRDDNGALAVTTHSRPAAFRTISEAADWVIDQFICQIREARAEHDMAAAKLRAECNSQVAEIRTEFDAAVAQYDATVAQLRARIDGEVATLQRELAEARAQLSKLQIAKEPRDCTRT
jgi:hypothetical protein